MRLLCRIAVAMFCRIVVPGRKSRSCIMRRKPGSFSMSKRQPIRRSPSVLLMNTSRNQAKSRWLEKHQCQYNMRTCISVSTPHQHIRHPVEVLVAGERYNALYTTPSRYLPHPVEILVAPQKGAIHFTQHLLGNGIPLHLEVTGDQAMGFAQYLRSTSRPRWKYC